MSSVPTLRLMPCLREQLLGYRHPGFTGEDIPTDARELLLHQAMERIQVRPALSFADNRLLTISTVCRTCCGLL